jgi:transketolase
VELGKRIGLEYGKATRDAFGETLLELGRENPDIVVVDGDVANSTRTEYFAGEFPDRFFSVGIAESNLVGVASGLAASGKTAVASSFACFLLCNAYDQIRMGIAFPAANVKLMGSHSGISIGADGPSQMAIEDIALASSLPNFTVLVPADEPSTRAATRAMFELKGPCYLRTGRPRVPVVYPGGVDFEVGRAVTLRDGGDVAIVACGLMVAVALEAAHDLAAEGVDVRVIDMHTVKPLDTGAVRRAALETGALVTAEEHLLEGGLGSAVALAAGEYSPVPLEAVGIRNTYAGSGEPEQLLEKYGLMPEHVAGAVRKVLKRKGSKRR